jgi:hypothetical protein
MANNDRHAWRGDGPEPPCWQDPDDHTITYRSYSDYVFDDDEPVMNKPYVEAADGR